MAGDDWAACAGDVLPSAPSSEHIAAAFMRDPAVTEAVALHTPQWGGFSVWLTLNEDVRPNRQDLLNAVQGVTGGIVAPIRLITVAALPRVADGSIDFQELRHSVKDEVVIDPAALPKTPLQKDLCTLWQSVLMLQRPIGLDEDFRDLGGHSLLAVRMWADVGQMVGRDIAPRLLVNARTLRKLAKVIEDLDHDGLTKEHTALDCDIRDGLRRYTAIWQGHRRTPESVIVGRNVDAPRIPLFWCLQNETELDQLSRYLGADQPVYGMRSGHRVMVKSPENIRLLAAFYADEIKQIYPKGPLFLGGNCQAGVIAFELATILRQSGREVELLILHEKMVAERYDAKIVLSFGQESDRNPYLSSDNPIADFRPFYGDNFAIELVTGNHGQFFVEPFILDLAAMICRHRDGTPALSLQPSLDNQITVGTP
jgi:hypothetical protein